MTDTFHCSCCNCWRSIELKHVDKKNRQICAACLSKKLKPSMTRKNLHDKKYYEDRRDGTYIVRKNCNEYRDKK